MKHMLKERKSISSANDEAKKQTTLLDCVQQTAEWLEAYSRILQDLRQAPSGH